jgi:hypothetical protein
MKRSAATLVAKLAKERRLKPSLELIQKLQDDHGFRFVAVGGRENNYGSINIGSDPGYALIERVTNAVDAVIEREALRHQRKPKKRSSPSSPREAVEEWFAVPGGRVCNVPIKQRQALADDVVIKLLDSSTRSSPTIEIRDRGVGLTPAQVPMTILSLGEGNKIDKPYLAGAYGQGGSTALAFSPNGCLFVSRRQKDLLDGASDQVAVTFARFNVLDPLRNKNGRYEYLVDEQGAVPGIDPGDLDFAHGTAVVHYEMQVARYAQRMTQVTGSLWWLLQNALFDPVLPFWVEEWRASMLDDPNKADRRTIVGNYTRLSDDKKDKVEHQDSIDVVVPHSEGDCVIKVNYWVLRQDPDKPTSSQPLEAYVEAFRPIAYTFFGQTHGTDDRRFTSDRLALPYLAKSLIVQVELDNLPPTARRELLSSTRDRLKQLPLYDHMKESLASSLSGDETLDRLNDERKERILSKQSDSERSKLKERFARLMEKFKAGIDATARGKGGSDAGRPPASSPTSREPLAPLQTKEKPTFIKIANALKPIPMRKDRHTLIRLESDAPDGYLRRHVHAKLTVASDPDIVIRESISDFQGGRSRITVKLADRAKADDAGTLTVYLFTPDEKQITAKTTFRVDVAKEDPSTGSSTKAKVQVPDPIPIYRESWKELGWDETSVAEVEEGKSIEIFVNMDNRHIARLLKTGKYQETGIARMRNNYLLYAAFYAWMQHVASANDDVPEGEDFDEYQQKEMDRVAQTVVHAISAASRMDDED